LTSNEFKAFLSYTIGLALVLGVLNSVMVLRKGRNWGLPFSCLMLAIGLTIYRFDGPIWGSALFGVATLGGLVYDGLNRGRKKEPKAECE
jgi:hypothetical protein